MTAYLVIICIILVAGILTMSFLTKFLKDEGKDERGTLIQGRAALFVFFFVSGMLMVIVVANLFLKFNNLQFTIILAIFSALNPIVYALAIKNLKQKY